MSTVMRRFYEFGAFRIDCVARILFRDGVPVPVAPKAFDTLLVLVQNRGRVLDKDELMELLWPDSEVEEANLPLNVSALRKALGESPNDRRYILTIPGRGYRFGAEVHEVDDGQEEPDLILHKYKKSNLLIEEQETSPDDLIVALPSRATARSSKIVLSSLAGLAALMLLAAGLWMLISKKPAAQPARLPANSLAVLPFSADAQSEYLADGLSESLINNLSSLSTLRVTARATAFSYKGKEMSPRQVGQELNVSTVLTGRVTLRDDSLTVQVDLVDAATGTQKWGERYQRKLSDIFAVQEEIGKQITEKLRLRLSGEEQHQLTKRYTENAEAYQLYLLGLYVFNKKTEYGLRQAVDYFEQAIAKDPQYPLSYTGLANCYVTISAEEDPGKLLPKAKAAAVKALEIDNNLAEAHASLGWIAWVHDLDLAMAESELEQALKLNPNSGDARYRYARVLADNGQFGEAEAQAGKAVELDPLSIQYRKGVPYILYLSRRYDEAIAEYRKLVEIAPDFPQTQRELGLAYEQRGMYQEAFSQLKRAYEMPESYGRTMTRADIGHLYAAWGKRDEARQILAELLRKSEQSYVSAYDVAVIYAGLGDTEQALRWLDKAFEQRPYWLVWLKLDPRLDGLRTDPRFRALLKRVEQTP